MLWRPLQWYGLFDPGQEQAVELQCTAINLRRALAPAA